MMKIGTLAAAALMSSAASFAAMAQDDPVEITFFIWAGSNQGIVPTEVIEQYRKDHPNVTINILESNNTITYPKMVAAHRTTPDDPLVHCGFFNVDSMTKGDVEGMWVPMNPEKITNINNILEGYRREEDRGVPYQMSAIGILYNKDAVPEPPTSWTDLWSPEYKGRVTMFDYDTRALAIAARLNGGDEYNPDAGFETWAENAENFRALVDSNDGVKNLLVSGDAWAAPWFTGLAAVWIEEGAPFDFVIPKEGAIAFPLYLTIVDGVDDKELAVCEDLINTLLSGEMAGKYGKLTNAIPMVTDAVDQADDPFLSLDVAKNAIQLDYGHIAEVAPDWRKRWDREVKSQMR